MIKKDFDITNFSEGSESVIKEMGYLTANCEERMALLMSFVVTAIKN